MNTADTPDVRRVRAHPVKSQHRREKDPATCARQNKPNDNDRVRQGHGNLRQYGVLRAVYDLRPAWDYEVRKAFYGVPMAVQPMKAASAAVLIEPMDPSAIAGAGLVIGAFFLLMGMTGVVSRLARVLPGTIAAGLQLGLGLSLAALGIHLIEKQLSLGVAMGAFMLALMRYPRMPVALIAVVAGIIVGQLLGVAPPLPVLDFGWHYSSCTASARANRNSSSVG